MHFEEGPPRAQVFVLGCKVNQAEANGITQMLVDHGFQVDGHVVEPDLVVVNTCCVTARAEGKSRRLVHRLRRVYAHAKVVVTGCLAQTNPQCFGEGSENLTVVRNDRKADLCRILSAMSRSGGAEVEEFRSGEWGFADLGVKRSGGKAREFIKIQDGCPQSCAYCIVPDARGPARSLSPQFVLSHVTSLQVNGAAEIVLAGVNLGFYGHDLTPPTSLRDLLVQLCRGEPVVRFRLSSLEPQHLSSRLIDLVAENDRLCRHFHVPLQSGDDGILERMRRPYDVSLVKETVHDILRRIPDVCLGFDVIVGFPGETEEAFQRTMDLVRDLRAGYLHVFPFSPRPGTEAAQLSPRKSDSELRSRVERMRLVARELRSEFRKRCIGKAFPAVVESGPDAATGLLLARTDNYLPVYSRAYDAATPFVRTLVRVVRVDEDRVWGRIEAPEVVPRILEGMPQGSFRVGPFDE